MKTKPSPLLWKDFYSLSSFVRTNLTHNIVTDCQPREKDEKSCLKSGLGHPYKAEPFPGIFQRPYYEEGVVSGLLH